MIVSVSKACSLLCIGRTKLYELIKQEQLPAHKLGHRTVLKLADIEAFIENLPAK